MLYELFKYLDQSMNLSGAGVFQFLSFRAALAIILALIISLLFGGRLINYLRKKQLKETVRDLGLAGQAEKKGTPTMGGLIILSAILIPTILLAKLDNVYILLLLIVTVGLGAIGFIDDYIKIFKNDKGGLAAKSKLIGQCLIGLIVGSVMYFHNDVTVRTDISSAPTLEIAGEIDRFTTSDGERTLVDYRAPITNVPFLKNTVFNYSSVLAMFGESFRKYSYLLYIPFVTLIVMFISNGANLTDGIDGLATGVSAIVLVTLAIFAYVSGNAITADYLDILHLPNIGELVVFTAATVGACIGFLWYNAYPAQVFMGDTGSLALGGIIATLAILVRKEFLLPLLCGVFIIENLSVMIQVSYFKYTKRKTGTGQRVFLMSPLHHHYQKKGMHESKIVSRFWITAIFLAVLTFVTLKLR